MLATFDPAPSALSLLLRSRELSFLMEAHDALSARIAEEAGFKGLWASGLSIASTLGFRDSNEASWTQVVEAVGRIADVTSIPILVDGDTGFGNFNNARIVARKLVQAGAAGVCLEDKVFPKMNSFVGDRHPLADIQEYCGRLKAVKDTCGHDLVVVARLESFIGGHGLEDALERAHSYARAGADAILVHSRKSDPSEILSFCGQWDNSRPIIIVPTKYSTTPTDVFRKANISTVIWANHNMRAAVSAMKSVCNRIIQEQSVAGIEEEIASVGEIFELLDYQELDSAEQKYLPA
ncbi:phosphoenolpyruvate mutase [Rhizobium multihospitium]|uniref:phosphoenolpyruvate mutase n=1 Tax=Rhizobium multihospitium TaxID=410764 RepID=A0A1C3XBE8_9HYPH|nr:phosphoenolpyruvate mutase [Rhizobium multihospitium]SCB49476.1 phosphoenolpyruvate phosphomutase [Rhizobium multihospitium]